jgi:beta-galactosidase
VPTVPAPITIPAITLTQSAPLLDNLPKSIASALPAPMEHFGQNYGFVLYRTQLPQPMHGPLAIKDVHDFAAVYIDGKFIGSLDRRNAASDGSLPPVQVNTTGPARLDILVANDGRINVEHGMVSEVKGITEAVVLDGRPLSDWRIYPLPMTVRPTLASNAVVPKSAAAAEKSPTPIKPEKPSSAPHCGFGYGNVCSPISPRPIANIVPDGNARPDTGIATRFRPPAFFHAEFNVTTPADTFLDLSHLGKGVIWINGHNVGRFWNVGPQQTLYLPGPWLKPGANKIVVFDMLPTAHESIQGLDHPILNAPVRDQTSDSQQ